MSISSGIRIEIASDGSSAIIPELRPRTANDMAIDVDVVISSLASEKIISGINHEVIDEAVADVIKTGESVKDVVVASARLHNEIRCFSDYAPIDVKMFIKEVNELRKTFDFITQDTADEDCEVSGYWVSSNVMVFEVKLAENSDIFGVKHNTPPLPYEIKAGKGIISDQQINGYRCITEDCGFLAIDSRNVVHVLSPFVISEDRMSINLKLLAVRREKMVDEIINYISQRYQDIVIPECRKMTLEDVLAQVREFYKSEEESLVLEISHGRESTAGIPGQIEFLVNLSGRPDSDSDGNIKFSDFTSYCMVEQNQELMKVVLPVQGQPGIDVLGNLVECEILEDPVLEIEDSINVIEQETERLLTSTDSGCLIYSDNVVKITDTIIVPGNVGPESGSIKKGASSVIVKGNVFSGYSVESDGDIIIEGSIENGARIRCKNLSVHKGVFGHKSDIYISGNAEIGYIQGGTLRVLGDMKVLRYIMESEITCRGNLEVMGQGVSGSERGALIGGHTSVLGSVMLHSIGSASEITRLTSGIDTFLYDKLILCRNAMTALNTEVARIQHSIGFNLGSKEAVEKLKAMSPDQKKVVGEKLEKIKVLLAQLAKYEQQCHKVESVAVAGDLQALRIKIERHVIPITVLSIGIGQLEIRSKLKSVAVRLRINDLVAEAM